VAARRGPRFVDRWHLHHDRRAGLVPEVPPHTIEPRMAVHGQRANGRVVRSEYGDLHAWRLALEREVDVRSIRRVLTDDVWIDVGLATVIRLAKSIRRARREEVEVLGLRLVPGAEWRDVVQDVDAAPVRPDY